MAIVPENVVEAVKKVKASITMPKPTFQIEHKSNGSTVVQIFYDEAQIQEVVRDIIKQFNNQLDDAIIDKLARANGYIKKGE